MTNIKESRKRYRHFYAWGGPRLTLCVLEKDDYFSLGMSLCHKSDQPNKKFAREVAYSRAEKGEPNCSKPGHRICLTRDEVAEFIKTLRNSQCSLTSEKRYQVYRSAFFGFKLPPSENV